MLVHFQKTPPKKTLVTEISKQNFELLCRTKKQYLRLWLTLAVCQLKKRKLAHLFELFNGKLAVQYLLCLHSLTKQ